MDVHRMTGAPVPMHVNVGVMHETDEESSSAFFPNDAVRGQVLRDVRHGTDGMSRTVDVRRL